MAKRIGPVRRGRPATLDLSSCPPGAVRSWIEMDLAIPGRRLTDALGDLNDELGTRYQPNRLYEWLHRRRPVPDAVRQFAARSAVGRVLRTHGVRAALTDAQLDAIADALG